MNNKRCEQSTFLVADAGPQTVRQRPPATHSQRAGLATSSGGLLTGRWKHKGRHRRANRRQRSTEGLLGTRSSSSLLLGKDTQGWKQTTRRHTAYAPPAHNVLRKCPPSLTIHESLSSPVKEFSRVSIHYCLASSVHVPCTCS